MPSLRQILAAHGTVLLIDAASARIQVGVFRGSEPARWAGSDDEAGVGVFRCLEQLAAQPEDFGAWVYCDGPGSVLGIRTVAMTLRTWGVLSPRPIFAYHSLAIVAQALGRPGVTIIADARRDAWHSISVGSDLRRIPTAKLSGDLVMPEGFGHWTPLPATVTRTSYSLADLLPQVLDADLFRPTDAPDAFLHEEPSYATWSPQVHRAP